MNRRQQESVREASRKALKKSALKDVEKLESIFEGLPDALHIEKYRMGLRCGVIPSGLERVGTFRLGGGVNPQAILRDAQERGLIPIETHVGYDLYRVK